jgi:hypothetical protein
VIVNYVAGNIERPYVMGSVEAKMPAQMKSYQQVFQTPAEQKILMTDGTGAGLTALLASFNPGLKLLQGFWPGDSLPGLDFEKSANLEGNIELTDKYGFYSIKGSTNERNISIKSPWGDVKINAFTGITLSAPNGDIKIKGKNVSIEAGGNITLASGKNIKQKFLMDGEDLNAVSLAATITKTVTSKLSSMLVELTDLSLLRHVLEVMFKPVEGKVQITAGRFLMMEAGGKKAGYPIEAYKPKKKASKSTASGDDRKVAESFEQLRDAINDSYLRLQHRYETARDVKGALAPILATCVNMKKEAQCKKLSDIIPSLWDNPQTDINALLAFTGLYEDVEANGQCKPAIMKKFLGGAPTIAALKGSNEEKQAAWAEAVARQNAAKNEIKEATSFLASCIKELKDFQISTANIPEDYDKVREVFTAANLPDDCLLKKQFKDLDGFKDFSVDYQVSDDEKKKVLRKLSIALVNALQIPRAATESAGLGLAATVFPEPAYDCSDADWAKYVRSIQTLVKKEEKTTLEKVGDAVVGGILDPLKGMFDVKGFMEFADDFSFGSSKKGEILFASGDGTMVLDRGIYRANTGLEDYEVSANQPQVNGPATRVRNVMLGANA